MGMFNEIYPLFEWAKKDNEKYKTEADSNRAEAINNRQPNEEILEHERKRKMEVKIFEFEEILEDQNYTAEEVAAKVQAFREKLMNERKEDLPKDEFGRYSVRDTHQIAAAKQEKNAMLRSAFGISEYFVEGSSFDADRKAKEELTKSTALQKELDAQRTKSDDKSKRYRLVRSPSPERTTKTDKSSKDHKRTVKDNNKNKDNGKEKEKSAKQKSKDKKHSKDDDRSKKDKNKKSKRDSSSDGSSSSSDEEKNKKTKCKRKYALPSGSSSSSSSSSSDSSSSSSSSSSESSDSEREKSKRSRKRNRSRSQSDNDRKHRRR